MTYFNGSRSNNNGDDIDTSDDVLTYLQSSTSQLSSSSELRCEEILNDTIIEQMDRIIRRRHSDINLISLELPNNGLTAKAGRILANILESQGETLQRLDVSNNPLTKVGVEELIKPLISNHHHHSSEDLQNYSNHNHNNNNGSSSRTSFSSTTSTTTTTNLISLNLTDTQLGRGGENAISNLLRYNNTIKELYIGKNRLGTQTIKNIASYIAMNTNLEILSLSYNKLKLKGATLLVQALNKQKELLVSSTLNTKIGNSCMIPCWNLRILDLTCNEIGDKGIKIICDFLVLDRKLEGLYINENKITIQGIIHIANVLKHNYTLRELQISNNDIDDMSCNILIDSLTNNTITRLERIDLNYNKITNCDSISNMLKRNSTLLYINLIGNQIYNIESLLHSLKYNLTLYEINLSNNKLNNNDAYLITMTILNTKLCRINKIYYDNNPNITNDGLLSLQRIPQIKKHQQFWLGQIINTIASSSSSSNNNNNNNYTTKAGHNINLFPYEQIIGNEEIILLESALTQYKPLISSLCIGGKNITNRSIIPFITTTLGPLSSSCCNIVRLYLKDIKFDDDGAKAIGNALKCNNNNNNNNNKCYPLEVLSLYHCSIKSIGAKYIANGLHNNNTLRRLNLDRNKINDDGLLYITNILPHVSLQSLSVNYNNLTDQIMSYETLSTLLELHLNGNNITDNGALQFCLSLRSTIKCNKCKLEWLSLCNNKLSSGGKTLRDYLPTNAYFEC